MLNFRSDTPETDLPLDVLVDLLTTERRRLFIDELARYDVGARVALGDVAEEVAAAQYDKTVGDLERQERKRVHVGLLQTHVPLLADYSAVKFRENGEIEITEGTHTLADVLDHVRSISGGEA